MVKTSSISPLSILLVVSAIAHLGGLVHCLPIQDEAVRDEMTQEVLQNMAAILSHEPARLDPSFITEDIRTEPRRLHHPVFFGTDLSRAVPPEVLQTILEDDDVIMPGGRKSFRLPEGRPLLRKRTFDSISRNSGFGNSHSWGSSGRTGHNNLSFTFESLFPAIARGLRSVV